MEIKYLSDYDHLSIKSLIGHNPPVVFAGSGISLWAPSNLPTGRQFTNSIYSLLFQTMDSIAPSTQIIFDDYFEKLPFEVINERCPEPAKIKAVLRKVYDIYTPNPVHELLAQNLYKNNIASIVTSNYDCCLDSAIANVYGVPIGRIIGNVKRIINRNDSYAINNINNQIYFKIHGSTDDKYGKSLVFCLNQEGVLPLWKRNLLRKMLHNRNLLVIGYSGSDFDICPEIALAEPKGIIWLVREKDRDKISPNIEFLSNKCKLTILIGDMIELFSLLYSKISPSIGASTINLDNLLSSKFNDNCIVLWRIRILNSINFNNQALKEAKNIINNNFDEKMKIAFLSEYAGAAASSGKYLDAAKTHDKAATIAHKTLLPKNIYITQLLLACDAWRCYGSFVNSISRYLQAKALVKDMQGDRSELEVDLDRNLILLIRHLHDLFQKLRLLYFSKKIEEISASAISRSIEFYRKHGAWHQLQQLGLWREKFNLGARVSVYQGYETPPAYLGYQQLSFPMGYMMAFRNDLKQIKRALTNDEVKEIRELINIAKKFGINPEIWKLNLIVWRRAPKKQRTINDLLEFKKYFLECQYTILFRVWRLLIGD